MAEHAPPRRAIADSKRMTRKSFHRVAQIVNLRTLRLEMGLVPSKRIAAQVPRLNDQLRGIEQARSLLTGPETEVLISELRGHATARRAIEEADLN